MPEQQPLESKALGGEGDAAQRRTERRGQAESQSSDEDEPEEPRSGCCGDLGAGGCAGLLGAAGFGLLDTYSDWAVVASFAADGRWSLFVASFTIQLICGCVLGLGLAFVLSRVRRADSGLPRTLSSWRRGECLAMEGNTGRAFGIGIGAGLVGLAPLVVAGLALSEAARGRAERAEQDQSWLKTFALVELVLEGLPQSCLQTYVGISYGSFSPSAEDFSALLVLSVILSFLSSGK